MQVSIICNTSNNTHTTLDISCIYNRQLNPSTRSHSPHEIFNRTSTPTIVLGDFNIHHPNADPLRSFNYRELNLATPYFDTATRRGYTLINTPGVYTRISPDQNKRHGVIDLAFANTQASTLIRKWLPITQATGSDHRALAISIHIPSSDFEPFRTHDWARADWSAINPILQQTAIKPPAAANEIDDWFDKNYTKLTDIIKDHTPIKTISKWSKKWWNPNITQLRKIFHSVHRAYRKGNAPPFEMKAARNAYFNAIKKAKQEHWNSFISNAQTKDVWRIKKMVSRTEDKIPTLPNSPTPMLLNQNLIKAFFPPRPDSINPSPVLYPNTPPISSEEVYQALSPTSNLSAPGPDTIPYPIWKGIHKANPLIITTILNQLLIHGYHPLALKQANGVILAKPNKPDYAQPSAYRVIVLLQTFSKILEKIVTTRLANIAKGIGLVHPHQCGSVAGLSTADAATTLLNETRAMQAAKLKVTTLFLDVKGGFDHVLKTSLKDIMIQAHIPTYIINWTMSFMSDRYITLLYKGSPKIACPIHVGVPQGSPISPLLFLIYINFLHRYDPHPGISISYVDDLAITVGSPTYQENITILTNHYNKLTQIAQPHNIFFSVPKTELAHWRTPKDRAQQCHIPITLENHTIHPKQHVKWIGFWLSQSFNPNEHYKRRLTGARATFGLVQRFSSAGKGLSSNNCRKIALLSIRPMLTYGAAVLTPTSSIKEMNTFWNSVLRWATGCFRSTNQRALWGEANSPPLDLYFHFLKSKYAIRILLAPPLANPVTGRTAKSFPTISRDRDYSHTDLLKGLPNPPKKWNSKAKKGVNHLPIEHLCAIIKPLIEEGIPHNKMAARAKTQLIANWNFHYPPPAYYPHPLTTTPQHFTNLHKFVASRIHQMRAGKSYLRGQKSWINIHLPDTCTRCNQEPETPSHVILRCQALEDLRPTMLKNIASLDDIWKSYQLTMILSGFIIAAKINFPIPNTISPLYSGTSISTLTTVSTSESQILGVPFNPIYAS